MRRSAVIFVLIFTLLAANICTGCGGNSSGAGDPQSSVSSGSGDNGAGKTETDGQSDAAGKTDGTGQSDDAGKTDGTGQSDSAGKTGDAASIPDTNESAVSDWGVADDGNSAETGAKSTSSGENNTDPSFSQVLVDNEDLYFAIKSVRDDSALGYEWKVYAENRTDRNLMFSFEKVSVNGVMCDPFWAEVINAGKKGNCEITWMRDTLENKQIGDVTQVDFTLNVYNDDDYTEAALMHDPFTVYPLGEENAAATVREPAETDHILVDDDNCSVIITGYEPDNSWGYAMKLYLVNRTDSDMVFSVNDSSVNGIMCDPFWAEIVCAGKSSYSTVLWDKSALEKNDITSVEEISLPLTVYADEDIGNPYVDETFELTPGAE